MNERIEQLMKRAFEVKASDLHLTVGVPPIMRIDGSLKRYGQDLLKPSDLEEMTKYLMDDSLWAVFKERGELDFSYGLHGVSRFRINAYHQRGTASLSIRVVPTRVPPLEELSLPSALKQVAVKPQGLVLVTGPTGSGKSTTLASMVDYMNRTVNKHIVTLEDPIEYLHKHGSCIINQREVGLDTKNFANGLRAALRQDPDVILVGEMRDLETIHTAITAAETGHLVLGTLHTSSAPSTINRIIDVFPPSQQGQIRIQLASVLVGILSQRLFPRKDQAGRACATELLINNPAVANLIRNEKVHQIESVMQTSKAAGMHTLMQSMNGLIEKGIISKADAQPYLNEAVM
ncbi:type IV pilus twitching motility protein PilT [Metabacillus iocasae]|uniref:Twitching motility protein PilT n=1 Tax=Priestia iocasae TaxID=2291674 RepID=A0ABS2QPG9_9BACI|nr:type IV pilus twitching motility protein PilT [Metabacillus iocasae]MBM7701354.1 twitching motility protein PilT [Metabacillus iocasae]